MRLLYSKFYHTITRKSAIHKITPPYRAIFYSKHYVGFSQGYHRNFSSNVLGYSPMANAIPTPSASKGAPKKRGDFGTVNAETALKGGVWAQTSAKRDKIVELKTELKEGEYTLDDAATASQKLDLDLADGFKVLTKAKDEGWEDYVYSPALQEILDWLEDTQQESETTAILVNKQEFEAHLTDVIRKSDKIIQESNATSALALVRDFMEPPQQPNANVSKTSSMPSESNEEGDFGTTTEEKEILKSAFHIVLQRYQSLLLKAASEHLLSSWDSITAVTDGDVDRSAIKGMDPPEITSLPLTQVNKVLKSYVNGTCQDTVAAWWDLMDHDQDGLLDESQMAQVAENTIRPFHNALPPLFAEAVEAYPVTLPLLHTSQLDHNSLHSDPLQSLTESMSWRQKRREKKAKKKLIKIFSKTIQNHFDIEVETPHRLRCIYAWAEKGHQNNKIESVLLDTGASNTVSVVVEGRKRYVELQPKISMSEFLVEQQDHFKQLDRVGQEIFGSFKEDLLVVQGKGRQNSELRREMGIFFVIVTLIDTGISFL